MPIKYKLIAIITAVSLTLLALVTTAFVYEERERLKEDMSANLSTLATLIAEHSTAAVSFADEKAAKEMLGALKIKRSVVAAAIYSIDGTPLAIYESGQKYDYRITKLKNAEATRFEDRYLLLYEPILINGEKIGTVFIISSLSELEILWQDMLFFATVSSPLFRATSNLVF